MRHIQRVSTYLILLFNILLVILPLSLIAQWALIDTPFIKQLLAQQILENPIQTPAGYVDLSTAHWTIWLQIMGFSAGALGVLPIFLSLFSLKAIFQNYRHGEVFSSVNAKHYRYLGWLFFLDALLAKPISESLTVLMATLFKPPGQRYLTVTFGSPNLEAIFYGALLIVISWVMLEASQLYDEQKLTV